MDDERFAAIRTALEKGKEAATILLSEFPERKENGSWVEFSEVEQSFDEALAVLTELQTEVAAAREP